ncbi:ABC transporter substrate-binding protein [Leucothrix mucor]|uniref:ABC transporter substrate-binding protein n=1 Tax=Leucothrix mucor TaxID=45248 RepID=UPI0003B56A0C|nr:extracellular solute-binding protein [Leucothrix mucor]
MSHSPRLSLSRRRFLQTTAGGIAGLALGSRFAYADSQLPSAINSIKAGSKLRWVDSGDQKAVFYKQFFAEYAKARNIDVVYDPLPWKEIAQVVPLGVRNKTAHDVFALPQNDNPANAMAQGWIQPFDDFIPDMAAWKAKFPAGAFLPGVNEFEGKTYGLPFTSNKRYTTQLLFNRKYMKQAGFDPDSSPLTWSQFRGAAKKITEQGKGRYFGFIIGGSQLGRWSFAVRDMGRMAGASAGGDGVLDSDIDFRTGEYVFDSEQYIGAVELFIAMKKDRSFFPGTMGLNAPQARAYVPQGAAGMILQGPWNIPQWEKAHPDFDFGIVSGPVPDEGPAGKLSIGQGASLPNTMWLYSGSENGAIAGDIFHYLGSLEGQIAWANIVGAGDPPIMSAAIEKADMSPRAKSILKHFDEAIKVGPNPLVRKPALAEVANRFQAPDVSFAQTVQGLVGGQLKDVSKEMKALKQRYNDSMDKAFEKARKAGADVSRDDLVFADWNPDVDYTSAS